MGSDVWNFILQIFREPAFFLALIVLVGLLLRKSAFQSILESVLKTTVGVRILQVGTGLLVDSSKPAINAIIDRFQIEGRIADPWLGVGEGLEKLAGTPFAGQVGLILILAWVLHLLLSRLTRLKVVYLTMQVAFVDTVLVTFFVYSITGWLDFRVTLFAVILLAIYWWFWPALLAKPVRILTDGEDMTIGHQLVVGSWLAIWISKIFKDKSHEENDSEKDRKKSGWYQVLQEPVVAYSLIMGSMYTVIGILAGSEVGYRYSNDMLPPLFFFLQGMSIAVGVTILMAGVKMMLAELLPAFEIISQKIIPGAIPALDIPVFWVYAPRGALVGLVFNFFGMLAGMLGQIIFRLNFLTIPSVLPVFFGGSTLGVIGYKFGGFRGAAVSTFILGVIQVFGSIWLANLAGFELAGGGNIDYCLYWPVLLTLFNFLKRLL